MWTIFSSEACDDKKQTFQQNFRVKTSEKEQHVREHVGTPVFM